VSIFAYQLLQGLGFSEQRLLALLPTLKIETLLPNQIFCRRGSPPQGWFHVVTGMVCGSIPNQGGRVTPMHIFGPGTWFGEVAILNRGLFLVDGVCLTPVRMLSMSTEQFEDAFNNEPEFSRRIARLVSWRIQQHAERLIVTRLGSPQLRVAMGLAMFAEALHTSDSHRPASEFDEGLKIPLKQSLLASLCGVSRGVFSDCVQQLSVAGWVSPNYATLELSRVAVWRKFSSQYRQNRLNIVKPSMPEILSLLEAASADAPAAPLLIDRRAKDRRKSSNP